jgi:aminomethyltransferase
LRTPLYELHLEFGARMVPFAGYEMPVQYAEGLRAEHLWTRSHAGLFDVSHMGQIRVSGKGLAAALERALPVDFDVWPPGTQKYSLILNERGGIDDDLMVARLESGEVAIVANASRKAGDLARLRELCPDLEVAVIEDALLALQGPRAAEILSEAADLKFMQTRKLTVAGFECLVSRSGYTGEDGFEISLPSTQAVAFARKLLDNPLVKPIGLGARDTLRLEAGLPLHGQDIDARTTPHEAGLAWAIAPSRRVGGTKAGGFPGAALVHCVSRRLVGLVGEEAVPVRHGAVLVAGGTPVGVVTSGTVSPTLGKPVMMAYVDAAFAQHEVLQAVVRDQPHPVRVTPMPFVPKRYKR